MSCAHPAGATAPQGIEPVVVELLEVEHENLHGARGERVLVTALTKRLCEDLTAYLHREGLRVRYLHSEIETLERLELLRDLRGHVRRTMTKVDQGLLVVGCPDGRLAIGALVSHIGRGHGIAPCECITRGIDRHIATQTATTLLKESPVPLLEGEPYLEPDLRRHKAADRTMRGQRITGGYRAGTADRDGVATGELERRTGQSTAGLCIGRTHRHRNAQQPQQQPTQTSELHHAHACNARRPMNRPSAKAEVTMEPLV